MLNLIQSKPFFPPFFVHQGGQKNPVSTVELKSINFDNMNFQNFSPILTTVLTCESSSNYT